MEDFFPFGTHYYCSPTPLPDEWEGDFRTLADAGYTHVQFRTLWRWHERVRGEFQWEDTDRLFDLAAGAGLRVILKPMLENAPDYTFTELEGTRIGFHGVPLTRFAMNSAYYLGGFMPCFDNPGVIEAAKEFLGRLVDRYCNHPALWYYDAWNEPRSRPMAQCHCAHSVASYRRWLESNFGKIEELNARFYKVWASYESVIPPASNNDVVELFLWRQWAAYAVSEQVRFVCETIRAHHPDAKVAVHVGASSVVQDPVVDTSDDLLNSAWADRYGTSLNISHEPSSPIQHNEAEYQSSWLRRVDPRYWCHEFYPVLGNWARPSTPRVLGQHLWMALAGGCSALTFWEYRAARMGIKSSGFGMRESDGSPTERSKVCDQVASTLREHGTKLAMTRRVPARVGLLYSRESDLVLRILKMHSWMGNLQNQTPDVSYAYRKALRAALVSYQAAGEAVDFVVPGDDVEQFDLLHIAAAEMVDAKTAEWLRAFVRNGGTAIIEFPFACRDEKTWLHPTRPGHGLADLLGCKEAVRIMTDPKYSDIAAFESGHEITADGWRVQLEAQGGEPIAHWQDGSPAGVRHSFGQGAVYALGVSPSLSFRDTWKDPVFSLFEWLLADAGIERPADGSTRRVWVRKRRGPGGEIWFVFNVGEVPARWDLPSASGPIWHSDGATRAGGSTFQLEPGAYLVLEIPRDVA